MLGDIMAVSRLRMASDGQGVSTLVTFFGCPLRCKYCVNEWCHESEGYLSTVPRAVYTPEELLEVLKKDEIYYLMTGGGIVFGGGEPLLQSAFIHEVCVQAEPGWKKRIETSLNVPWDCVEPLLCDLDEWIVDVKDTNCFIYEKYTGAGNEKVLSNLYRLCSLLPHEKIHIRVPQIEGYNTPEDVEKSVEWIQDMLQIEPEVFAYSDIPRVPRKPRGVKKLEIPEFLKRANSNQK